MPDCNHDTAKLEPGSIERLDGHLPASPLAQMKTCALGFYLQLEEARQQGTSGPGNDAELPLRPLVEILREAKEKKEEDFQAQWRQMKQGETLSFPCYLLYQSLQGAHDM